MGGQVTPFAAGRSVVVAVWVALGCNQLTGVGDLKVARCGADAGADAGPCETQIAPSSPGGGDAPGVPPVEPELGDRRAGGSDDVPENGNEPSGDSQRDPGDGEGGGEGGGAMPPVERAGSVGAACAADGDCGPGLGCTTAQATSGPFGGDGAQGGFCSRPCSADADCLAADRGALCVSHAQGPAFCFPACAPLSRSFPDQCNARSELLCLPLAGVQGGYCAPACQSDEDCAPRACDLATGLCSERGSEGAPIGAACTANEDCAAGLCVSLAGQPAACTGLCTLGSLAGCGFGEQDSERSAACTIDTAASLGLGVAVGLCQELCNVDEDCLQAASGWGCTPWPDAQDEERFSSTGFCEPLAAAGAALVCNDSCLFAGNGSCDDETSFLPLCDPGTDCTDCGPRE